ncbi:unnamed protein product [Musa acuminata subsp. burmannicoides]
MATYGGVLRRSAAVVEHARDSARSTRRALARFARPQAFAAPPDAEAAARIFLNRIKKFPHILGKSYLLSPNSALLRQIVDRRLVAALLMAVIGAEIVMTSAVPQFLLAMAVGVPLVLLHALFRTQDDPAASGEETTAGNGGDPGEEGRS